MGDIAGNAASPVTDPGTAAIVQAGSDLFGTLGNISSTILTNRQNKRNLEDQRNWNLKMWQMQNEYNTPAAQMARFKAAGLNPNLIYGQGNGGNAGSVASTSPVSYRAPSVDIPDIMGLLSQFQQLENMRKMGDKIDSETNVNLGKQELIKQQAAKWFRENIFYAKPYGESERQSKADNYTYGMVMKLQALSQNLSLQKELIELRKKENENKKLELGMNEQLKPYNLTQNDPAWMRLILNFGSKSGLLKRFLGVGEPTSILKNYNKPTKFNNGFTP